MQMPAREISSWWKRTAGIMKFILLISAFVLEASCNVGDVAWIKYKEKYNKAYGPIEDGMRYTLWENRKRDIKEHNKGNSTYKMGINYFTDLFYWELQQYLSAPLKVTYSDGTPLQKKPGDDVPDSINWVTKGAVTKVKDQKSCGSAYAFSAAGALEGLMFRANQTVRDLSAQELMDCDTYNYGCKGGWPQHSFEYVKKRQLIDTDRSYPYAAQQGACQDVADYNVTTCGDYLAIESEDYLEYAVGVIGPTSIMFSVDVPNFFMYESGIYDDECGLHQDHSMLAVGYDRDEALGKDYWLVKNSWSDGWGEKGYVKLLKNVNLCHIGEKASIPVMAN